MSAKPGQPVGEDGKPITLGVATYTETPDTLAVPRDEVEGHMATVIPTDGQEPGPTLAV